MLGLGSSITSSPAISQPFSIGDISGLQLWLKFNDQTLDGTDVVSWADSSGNNNDAAQATASRRPVYDNGEIGFNETSDQDHRLDLTSSIVLGKFTIVASIRISNVESMGLMGNASDNCIRIHQGADVDRVTLFLPSESADMTNLTSNIPADTTFTFTMTRGEGPDDNVIVRFDGSDVSDTNADRNDSDPTVTLTISDIGSAAGNFLNFRGFINEVAIFNDELSGDLLTSVENDISARVQAGV